MASQTTFRSIKRLLSHSCLTNTCAISIPQSAVGIVPHKFTVRSQQYSVQQNSNILEHRNRLPLSVLRFGHHCEGHGYKNTFPGCVNASNAQKAVPGYVASESLCAHDKYICRYFSTTQHMDSQIGFGGSSHDKPGSIVSEKQTPRRDWTQRLANENGYLSWCRNSYLTTVVAIAMMGEGKTALAEQAAEGALFVAGLNLSWGTYQYIYNIFHLRHVTGMSFLGACTYSSFALLHLALWFMVCAVYLGYSEDLDMKAIEEEAERQSKRTSNE